MEPFYPPVHVCHVQNTTVKRPLNVNKRTFFGQNLVDDCDSLNVEIAICRQRWIYKQVLYLKTYSVIF